MNVPEKHITPKLESLPKGLQELAEKIIKKKFGLETSHEPDDFVKLSERKETKFDTIGNIPNSRYTIEHPIIERNMLNFKYTVYVDCPGCGSQNSSAEMSNDWQRISMYCSFCHSMLDVMCEWVPPEQKPTQYVVGKRVYHHEFGYGTIRRNSPDASPLIQFDMENRLLHQGDGSYPPNTCWWANWNELQLI